MADHDGHTVNVGPVSVGKTLPKADPIDTDILRSAVWLRSDGTAHATLALCDEVDRLRMVEVVTLNYEREQIDAHRRRQEAEAEAGRLRAENAALAAALSDAFTACVEDGAWAAERVMLRALAAAAVKVQEADR